jgi:hypothetical protein
MVISLLLLAACTPEPDAAPEKLPTQADVATALTRISMDVRGVRPSVEDLAAVEADPSSIDELTDVYLHDARFAGRVRDLWSEIYLTRSESYLIYAYQYGLDDQAGFQQSIGDEPLQILSYIADHDLPYTDLVTADWTMANETLAQMWPLDYPAGETGWKQAHYTDGRPAAGVMATNSMWWRYTSTASNANRKRANAVSRILLCNDYLVRPIEFDRNVNLLDADAVSSALQTNPACLNCHTSLDPLASYFFGFWWYDYTNPGEASYYFPEREPQYRSYTGTERAYYGDPGFSLADLGQQIAGDNRFPMCATEQATELLLRRPLTVDDAQRLIEHRDAFISGGLTVRALLKSIVSDPAYLAGSTDEPGFVPSKMLTADLLASTVEDLTGFTWTYANYDMLRTDAVGFRTLAGGADGYNVTATARTPNATLVLVQERLAEAAAAYAVHIEPERLFPAMDFSATPETDKAAVVAEIQYLHRRVLGHNVEADGAEVAAALDLWAGVYAVEGTSQGAWAGVLSALLRDPDFLYY